MKLAVFGMQVPALLIDFSLDVRYSMLDARGWWVNLHGLGAIGKRKTFKDIRKRSKTFENIRKYSKILQLYA